MTFTFGERIEKLEIELNDLDNSFDEMMNCEWDYYRLSSNVNMIGEYN